MPSPGIIIPDEALQYPRKALCQFILSTYDTVSVRLSLDPSLELSNNLDKAKQTENTDRLPFYEKCTVEPSY